MYTHWRLARTHATNVKSTFFLNKNKNTYKNTTQWHTNTYEHIWNKWQHIYKQFTQNGANNYKIVWIYKKRNTLHTQHTSHRQRQRTSSYHRTMECRSIISDAERPNEQKVRKGRSAAPSTTTFSWTESRNLRTDVEIKVRCDKFLNANGHR